jgi:predicted DNA-binding transcriptional regulator AlpA
MTLPQKDRHQTTGTVFHRRKVTGPVYLTAPEVLNRYGVSHMWLVRRLETDPKFPKPIKMGRLRFFKIGELEEYERQCAAAPPSQPSRSSKAKSLGASTMHSRSNHERESTAAKLTNEGRR